MISTTSMLTVSPGNCHSQKSQRGQRPKDITGCKTPTFHLWNATTLRNQPCFPSSKEQRPVVNILLRVRVRDGGDMGGGVLG